MAFNFFTAFHSALQDAKSYYAFQKEMNLKAVEQVFFNSLAGQTVFDAVILPEDLGSDLTFDGLRAVRVRPLGITDFILPEPCDFECEDQRRQVIAMHPVAYPDISLPRGEMDPDSQPFDVKVVECFFKQGPQSGGKLRGLTYRPKHSRKAPPGINLECLGITSNGADSAQKAFKKGDYAPYEPPADGEGSGVLDQIGQKEKKYIEDSKIKNNKTSDGKSHKPEELTYHGKISNLKGKKLKNGLLPQEMFGQSSNVASAYGGLFLKDVIVDFDRLAQAFKEKFGKKLRLVDSYRTFDRQISMKNRKIKEGKPGEAAPPGTSNHGWGLAFDFDTTDSRGVSGFKSETYKWMLYNAPRFGFESPFAFRDGKGVEESWHIQWIKISDIWR